MTEENGWRGRIEVRVDHLERTMHQLSQTCLGCRQNLDNRFDAMRVKIDQNNETLANRLNELELRISEELASIKLKLAVYAAVAAAAGTQAGKFLGWVFGG